MKTKLSGMKNNLPATNISKRRHPENYPHETPGYVAPPHYCYADQVISSQMSIMTNKSDRKDGASASKTQKLQGDGGGDVNGEESPDGCLPINSQAASQRSDISYNWIINSDKEIMKMLKRIERALRDISILKDYAINASKAANPDVDSILNKLDTIEKAMNINAAEDVIAAIKSSLKVLNDHAPSDNDYKAELFNAINSIKNKIDINFEALRNEQNVSIAQLKIEMETKLTVQTERIENIIVMFMDGVRDKIQSLESALQNATALEIIGDLITRQKPLVVNHKDYAANEWIERQDSVISNASDAGYASHSLIKNADDFDSKDSNPGFDWFLL